MEENNKIFKTGIKLVYDSYFKQFLAKLKFEWILSLSLGKLLYGHYGVSKYRFPYEHYIDISFHICVLLCERMGNIFFSTLFSLFFQTNSKLLGKSAFLALLKERTYFTL